MSATNNENQYSTLIAGGGIAGLVTALVLLEQGQTNLAIVDRDTPERLGGLARWAFGGMALCGTKEQQRANIADSPERLLHDWHCFADFKDDDHWPKLWAQAYANNNHQQVYLWLKQLGLRFLPAVNWVERGLYGEGNSLPRYHVLWGTGWQLVETIIAKLQPYLVEQKLQIFHQHKVITPIFSTTSNSSEQSAAQASVIGALVLNEQSQQQATFHCQNLVIACGGINGSLTNVRKHWPADSVAPSSMLNGANPISDGQLHQAINNAGGKLTNLTNMWNYAAGIAHPQAEFEAHGLSLIPCKSALWLNYLGERIGPMPLVTGFDTHYLCQQVAKQAQPWTWQLMNWRIAIKELAVSGSLHNPSIRDSKLISFLKEILFGNKRLVKQLLAESTELICADTLDELCEKMNQLTPHAYISSEQLNQTVSDFDQQFAHGITLTNDDQLRRIQHARQWRPDKLRTCKPKAFLTKDAGPLIAIKTQLISRKSLGGLQTNLASQVITETGEPMANLYCVGEAAGFGGGGASGLRSLEGTFLSGCILTAKSAAKAIIDKQ